MISDFISNIIPYITHFWQWVYFFVYIIALLESLIYTAFLVPWTTIIILISFFSVQNWLDIKIIFWTWFFWLLTWNIISYFIWFNYHKKNVDKIFKIIKLESIQKSKNVMENNAFKTLTIWRLVPVFKEVIFFLSGVNHMKFLKFTFFTIIWNIIWCSVYIWVPYIFSYSLTLAQLWIDKFSYFVLLLFFILLFFTYLKYLIIEYWKDVFTFVLSIFKFAKKIIFRQKFVKKIIEKYPNKVLFLKNRLKKDEFTWLPLTILSILIIYFILTFIWLIEDIFTSDIIVWLDMRLSAFFYAFRNDLLVNIFLWISSLWRELIVIFFSILVSIYLYIHNKKNEVLVLYISLFWSILTGFLLKNFFHHNRPELAVYSEQWYSFPSLHAVISISFYWYIFWIIIKESKKWKTKINYIFIFLLLFFLIWFSRLYLCVHYLSDVLWWYLIWWIWLFFSIWLIQYLNIKHVNKSVFKSKIGKNKILILFSLISSFIFITYNLLFPYKISDSSKFNVKEINIKDTQDIFSKNSFKFSQNFMWENAENINFIFLAKSDDEVKNIFLKANWEDADKLNYKSIKSMLWNLLFQKSYETAPITPLFWDNKTQDFSFQKSINDNNIRYRHHIRIWKSDYMYNWHFIYVWVWVFDDWLKWWYFTHKISPDVNKEREFIFSDLKKTNNIDYYDKISITKEYNWKNTFWDKFFSDGNAYLINIKDK